MQFVILKEMAVEYYERYLCLLVLSNWKEFTAECNKM